MRRIALTALGLIATGGAAFWLLTAPETVDPAAYAGLSGDATRGAQAFAAAGCAACHMAEGAEGEAKLILSGGQKFPSDFGTFVAPNISSHPQAGIGGWSVLDLANAVTRGVSPEGQHYYPAFPWDSYRAMTPQDLTDIHSYLATLPADPSANQPHELAFPFTLRRGIGLWKRAFGRDGWVLDTPDLSATEQRGRYLVEVMGHCSECHTPRAATGAPDLSRWLAGADRVPNITPGALDWQPEDIVEYLTSGFTPDFDSAGGHMALVVENYATLPTSDREAVAAYLQRIPARP